MHTEFRKGSSCSVATLKNNMGNNVLCKEAGLVQWRTLLGFLAEIIIGVFCYSIGYVQVSNNWTENKSSKTCILN
jgi:hypothetical protein